LNLEPCGYALMSFRDVGYEGLVTRTLNQSADCSPLEVITLTIFGELHSESLA